MIDLKSIDSSKNHYWLIPLVVGLLLRLVYHMLQVPDFWGDAYHNVYISNSTVANNWVYTDFKGREVVWLPFYRYLTAAFMHIFGSTNLTVPHYINIILGSASCAVLAVTVARESQKKCGLLAGMILALLPWHVAYSHMNMPEITASLILLLIVYCQRRGSWLWLFPLAFLAVLTKNELSLYIGFFGFYIIWIRDWKSTGALLLGGASGLLIWSYWNWLNTGELLWWITERNVGSSWDKTFYLLQGRSAGKWYVPIFTLLHVFPFVLMAFVKPKPLWAILIAKGNGFLRGLVVVVVASWIFIVLMNLNYFPAADARYFMITLPIAALIFVVILYQLNAAVRLLKSMITISAIILIIMIPIISLLHLSMSPSIEMGHFIKEKNLTKENYWLDFPVTLYYSELPYDRINSSEMILPRAMRENRAPANHIRNELKSRNIRYVAFQEVSYSYVGMIWPQMSKGKPFEWHGLNFEPVYIFERERDSSIGDRIRSVIIGNRTSSLWKINN